MYRHTINLTFWNNWFDFTGIPLVLFLSLVLLTLAGLGWVMVLWIKKGIRAVYCSKGVKDLGYWYDFHNIKQCIVMFIPTRFQPCFPDVPDDRKMNPNTPCREKLISWFIKNGFSDNNGTDKFYLVLADPGAGKTTFLINLYVRYHFSLRLGKKNKMKFLNFGAPGFHSKFREIMEAEKEKEKTILLLDAFNERHGLHPSEFSGICADEDRFALDLNELWKLTGDFRKVVVTSRLPNFSLMADLEDKHKKSGIGDEKFYPVTEIYLSPFSPKEIKQYLNKKYGCFFFRNHENRQMVRDISKIPSDLLERPMFLNIINGLGNPNKNNTLSYNLYENLIKKWIGFEVNKGTKATDENENMIDDLFSFSTHVATEIYLGYQQSGGLSLEGTTFASLCNQYHISLYDRSITGQLIFTCDSEHNWRFSQKSILEFFLAKKCMEDMAFAVKFDFSGMEQAKIFYEELEIEPITKYLPVKGGIFSPDPEYAIRVGDYYISKYLVTQAEYIKITGKDNPSHFQECDRNPVENVSWMDAAEYCNTLNKKAGFSPVYDSSGNLVDKDGNITRDIKSIKGFRLPTQSEWEYAALGGAGQMQRSGSLQTLYAASRRSDFSGAGAGRRIGDYAWYRNNSHHKTHPVGMKKPNQLGLYDMSGNVWEWCNGFEIEEFLKKPDPEFHERDPKDFVNSSLRIVRGGSWFNSAGYCRVTYRYVTPGRASYDYGFRLVFVP